MPRLVAMLDEKRETACLTGRMQAERICRGSIVFVRLVSGELALARKEHLENIIS